MLRGKRAEGMPGTRVPPLDLPVPEYSRRAGCFENQVEGSGLLAGKLWLPEATCSAEEGGLEHGFYE